MLIVVRDVLKEREQTRALLGEQIDHPGRRLVGLLIGASAVFVRGVERGDERRLGQRAFLHRVFLEMLFTECDPAVHRL